MKITEFFANELQEKTQADLDFINICLDTDNLLFIDPYLIKQSTQFLKFKKNIGSCTFFIEF